MATISDARSVNATLTTTTADVVQITQFWDAIEISNLDTTNHAYVTFDGTTPSAGLEGAFCVPAGQTKRFRTSANSAGVPGSTTAATVCHRVGIVGSGGSYSVAGVAGDY